MPSITKFFEMRENQDNNSDETITLPCTAQRLTPHRPPMLLVDELLEREADEALVSALAPTKGIFVDPVLGLLPEYYIELIAQSMAAVNGYDTIVSGGDVMDGFLVGIDTFSWHGTAMPGERLIIHVVKTFEFGPVKIISGQVKNDTILAKGEIKLWQGTA